MLGQKYNEMKGAGLLSKDNQVDYYALAGYMAKNVSSSLDELKLFGPTVKQSSTHAQIIMDSTAVGSRKVTSKEEYDRLLTKMKADLAGGCGDKTSFVLANFNIRGGKSRNGDYYRIVIQAVGFGEALKTRDLFRAEASREAKQAIVKKEWEQFKNEASQLKAAGKLLKNKGLFSDAETAYVACKAAGMEDTEKNVETAGFRAVISL